MVEAELVARVAMSTGLSPGESARVIADVVAYHREDATTYVRRRHARLQARGLKNDEIFARIRGELAERVVAAPPYTERQLRRLVYG
jgi:hypothetical protein